MTQVMLPKRRLCVANRYAMRQLVFWTVVALFSGMFALASDLAQAEDSKPTSAGLTISWKDEVLSVYGPELVEDGLRINFLEAYCRDGSTDRDWNETVIPHRTKLVRIDDDHRSITLQNILDDGVVVDHEIRAGQDELDFRAIAHNPTSTPSRAHWAQPCIHVDSFTGKTQSDYVPQCFIFVDGKVSRLPTEPWATTARYVPGQVYAVRGIDRNDVNPRPLSALTPSRGLIGCYSADGRHILATAWEPYQELFQGVVVCIHSDFRIGGLAPGERKQIRGKLYLVGSSIADLLSRYERDFPEHVE